jgi:hypothetical protein
MTILLKGAACMLLVTLVLAWTATFAKLIVVHPVQSRIKDYGSLIRAHIRYCAWRSMQPGYRCRP